MKISLEWIRDYVKVELPLQELADRMSMIGLVVESIEERDGDFILVLQAPPGGTMHMELGGKGPDVGWLRRQLEVARGIDLPSDDPLYLDYKLYQQVLAFQRDNGLVTDGIVGRYTIIQLNSHSGVPGIPRLSAEPS